MSILVVTNNCKVHEKYGDTINVLYLREAHCLKVLEQVRDFIHTGARLLSDPMAGNLRPDQTPYRSVLLECAAGAGARAGVAAVEDSLKIIENSIETARKYQKRSKIPDWPRNIMEDFMEVDLSLLDSAIRWGR